MRSESSGLNIEYPEDSIPKEVLEKIEPITFGDFLRRKRKASKELLKDIATRALPFADNHFSTLDLGVTHFGQLETGLRKLPEDLNYIIVGYQLNDDEVIQLKRANELELVLEEDKESDVELTNYGKKIYRVPARVEDNPTVSVANAEESEKERDEFEKKLAKLEPRLRCIIELRFGLGDDGKLHTLRQVGDIISLTPERVRILEHKGLKNMGLSYEQVERLRRSVF